MNTDGNSLPTALRDAAAVLVAVSETPRLDAELLMAHALGMERSAMLLAQRDLSAPPDFAAYIARRVAHEPVAYITGRQSFWDLDLLVASDVLIPRGDSETLIEAAITAFAGKDAPFRIVDLGTGSGALLLAALSVFPAATGLGLDASAAALGLAKDNAARSGFGDRAAFARASWHDADWALALGGRSDLILCNPPYVETGAILAPMVREYEPHRALFAGAEGLDDYMVLLPQIPALLSPDGVAIFEIGATQSEQVAQLARNAGMESRLSLDLAGKPRALTLHIPPAG